MPLCSLSSSMLMISLYMTDTCWPSPHVTKISHTQMQYGNMPQEGLQLILPYTYYFINLTKYIQKNYFPVRRMSRACHLTIYGQKHAKINCSKVQINLLYKMTFLIFNGNYCWNLLIKCLSERP